MTYQDLFTLKNYLDQGTTKNLISSTRIKIYDLADQLESLTEGFMKQLAKAYGGKINGNAISFDDLKNAKDGEFDFSIITKKIEEDYNQEVTSELQGSLPLKFLNFEEFEEFTKPRLVGKMVAEPDGSERYRESTYKTTIGEERFLRKYLVI